MGDGISNTQIQNFFENEENEDLKNNFVGVFSMDYVTKYIKFHELIKEQKKSKYPFAIFNTDPHNKAGTHWWSFLDIHPKKTYYYSIVTELMDLSTSLLTMMKK